MLKKHRFLFLFACLLLPFGYEDGIAQIPRERANQNGPVDEVFWTPSIILLSSVANLETRNLNFTIKHAFGIATNGPQDLFGLDASSNIRFGLDYGITDRISVGIGRSRFDKLSDFRGKVNVLRQTIDNRVPIELALDGTAGIMTLANGFDLLDRLSYSATVLVARKFSERLSVQIAPIYTHFNLVSIERAIDNSIIVEENDHYAVGLSGRFAVSQRMALLLEFVPVLGKRSDGTKDAASAGLNIETGGHVFQLFFTTSQSMTGQHVIARNRHNFFKGDFRFGFNVHRVFSL